MRNLDRFILGSLLAFLFSLASCHKEFDKLDSNPPSARQIEILNTKSAYKAQNIEPQLLQKFKNGDDFQWQPDWNSAVTGNGNDTISYLYIPLLPNVKSSNSNNWSLRKLAGTGSYLIAKRQTNIKGSNSEIEFFSAIYIFDISKGSKVDPSKIPNPYRNFSGTLISKNLTTGRLQKFSYANGLVSTPNNGLNSRVKQPKNTANAWICDSNFWRCIWQTDACGTSPQIAFTSGINDCADPDIVLNCGHWSAVQTSYEPICYYDSDPYGSSYPLPPYYNGTGGVLTGSYGDYSGTGETTPLEDLVDDNNMALYSPCAGLTDAWIPLFGFKAPSQVISRLNNLTADELKMVLKMAPYNYLDPKWQLQSLQDAGGKTINFDNFSVTLSQLPIVNGNRLSPEQFVEYVRTHINDFTGPGNPTFNPHPNIPGEAARWQNHEIGSVISIDIPFDNGSVILSDYSSTTSMYGSTYGTSWTFSTLTDPYNGTHPVSGNRRFGVTVTPDYSGWAGGYYVDSPPTYTFYIQGVDRIYLRAGELVGAAASGQFSSSKALQYAKADNAWNSFITNIANFANSHQSQGSGNVAKINPSVTVRPNWADVTNALTNHRPLQSVPCN